MVSDMNHFENDGDEELEALRQAVIAVFQSLEDIADKDILDAACDVVMASIEHHRAQKFINLLDEPSVSDYVHRVIRIYANQHEYIELVMAGSSEVWEELYVNMQRWAYHFLLRNNFHPDAATFELAVAYAGEAGVTLVNAHYPYDTEFFEPWAVELVKNICRKFMRKAVNLNQIPETRLSPLDATSEDFEIAPSVEKYVQTKQDLTAAFTHLSERERYVLKGIFSGVKTWEMAKTLETSRGNVYKIKFEAIQKLRKILG